MIKWCTPQSTILLVFTVKILIRKLNVSLKLLKVVRTINLLCKLEVISLDQMTATPTSSLKQSAVPPSSAHTVDKVLSPRLVWILTTLVIQHHSVTCWRRNIQTITIQAPYSTLPACGLTSRYANLKRTKCLCTRVLEKNSTLQV